MRLTSRAKALIALTAILVALASVFTVLRVAGVIAWRWIWVLSPLWALVLLVLFALAAVLAWAQGTRNG